MFTTVKDLIDALSQYPSDTPVFGAIRCETEREQLVTNAAIQGVTGVDRGVSQLLLYWFEDDVENRLGKIPKTGNVLPRSLCDY